MKKVLEEAGAKLDADGWQQVVTELMEDEESNDDKKNFEIKVSFDEYLQFYRRFLCSDESVVSLKKRVKRKLSKAESEIAQQKFAALDKDNSGTLDKAELKPLIQSLNVSLTDEQFNHVVANVLEKGDGNNDGVLDFEEFLYFYKRCLRSSDACKKWEEKLQVRYQDPELNYLAGL